MKFGSEISEGTIDAGIVIPDDLARNLERGQPTTVQVLLNAMNANTVTAQSVASGPTFVPASTVAW